MTLPPYNGGHTFSDSGCSRREIQTETANMILTSQPDFPMWAIAAPVWATASVGSCARAAFVQSTDSGARPSHNAHVRGRDALTRSLRGRELAGDARAGSYARTRARIEQRAYVRERWQWLLFAWAILAAPVPILWWLIPSELLRGVVLGAAVTGASATIWFWVVQSTGTAPLMMGDQAEQWTAQTLRKVERDWRLVNRLVLSYGDIDHVAVGPAGVLVVETKWSAHPWRSDAGIRRQHDAVRQVEQAARQLRLWHEVKTSAVRVRPVVALWGGATRHWAPDERVRYLDGVAVVAGHALKDWVRSLDAGQSDHGQTTRKVWSALDAQAHKREDREPERFAVPISAGEMFGSSVLVRRRGHPQLPGGRGGDVADTLARRRTALAGIAVATVAGVGARRGGRHEAPAIGAVVGAAFPTFVIAGAVALAAMW